MSKSSDGGTPNPPNTGSTSPLSGSAAGGAGAGAAGLLTLDPDWIGITPRGRLLVRAVCMVFDRYLRLDSETVRYSKVV